MTIREISSITNISFSTVYRALKNPDSVKPEVLEKIKEAMKTASDTLPLKQVYLIIPFINEFYTHFLIHATTILSKRGVQVIPFIYHENSELEEEFLLSLTLSPRIGLLWVPTGNKKDYPFLTRKKNKVPIILLFRQIKNYSAGVQILQDNKQAIEISLKHLISEGKKNILLINGLLSVTTSQLRAEYFLEALKDINSVKGTIITADYKDWKTAYRALTADSINLDEYDGIIATSEYLCHGAIKAVNEKRTLKRHQMDIISFDYTVGLETSDISMVYFSPEQIAQKAVEVLIEKVRSPEYKMTYLVSPLIAFVPNPY